MNGNSVFLLSTTSDQYGCHGVWVSRIWTNKMFEVLCEILQFFCDQVDSAVFTVRIIRVHRDIQRDLQISSEILFYNLKSYLECCAVLRWIIPSTYYAPESCFVVSQLWYSLIALFGASRSKWVVLQTIYNSDSNHLQEA